ncbi:nodulation-signaling pathway 2 protein-like [Cynara cardunculus var. scolymus]|uniref:Transcription factor GRAS n=1 Tax=Cynara cardunculus var. scolymus TaxID=59895 RepID=A0A118JWN7_CYNCS|nr:nodulation-signaling pathway 2 protein-like [Cynara cardunculus var. scolymus]KVH94822.1 Transcription factor GRAS [Cynara cardunculus var. scolymus]
MMLSELLLQPSYIHSDLDPYHPNLEFSSPFHSYFDSDLDFSSSLSTTPENSSSISSVNLPILSDYPFSGYNHMEGLDDVCRWLCDDDDDGDDDDQEMEQIPEQMPSGNHHFWSPDFSQKSSEAPESSTVLETDDSMGTGIQNLLMAYADAMGIGQKELADVIVKCIREKINPNGSPIERIAHNLFQPVEDQENAYLKLESARNFNPAFRAFYEIFPYGRFAHFTANSAILDSVPININSVHIVDFDMREGTQWPPVIEAMARTKKSLTITSIKLEDHDSSFEGRKIHLCNFARTFGLDLKVQEMGMEEMVKELDGREFLAFNCMVGLPHMGRTRKTSQIMGFLKLAKGILSKNEGVITIGNGEGGERMRNSLDYTSFFDNYLVHYNALYESMEWGFPSYLNEARMAMETLFVAPYVSIEKWEERREETVFEKGFGFKGERMSKESWNEAMEMVKEGESPYGIRVEGDNENEMVLEWRGVPLVRVSAWR